MTRRQFRRLTSASGPTLESLTRRKPSRRIFKDLNGCLTIPPVPYPGAIMRLMTPTAITDTETLQTGSNWGTGNYKPWWAWNASSRTTEFLGQDVACYTYALSVPAGTGDVSIITQPLRWSCIEPSADGGNFEFLKQTPAVQTGFEGFTNVRPSHQAFASSTLLPASGNSHVEDSTPYRAAMLRQGNLALFRTCYQHVGSTIGDYVTFTDGRPPVVRSPSFYIIGRYVRWRINGTAVGPLHDLKDFYEADQIAGFSLFDSQGRRGFLVDAPFPSSHYLWTTYGHLLENWNLNFSPGDTIEVDVWYEIAGRRVATGDRIVTISFGRHHTNNNQFYNGTTAPTASAGFTLRAGEILLQQPLEIYGLNMSNGFNPATHTYDFNPTDGTLALGKAQAAGAIRFAVTSKRLEWTYTETAGSGCGGTSTWRAIAIEGGDLVWVLDEDNCEGGGVPVAPPDPPTVEFETETTSCDCSSAGSGDTWYVNLELVYEFELVYLRVQFLRTTGTSVNAELWYRPESTADYVENVNDRWEGSMKCGPTGVFDHMGATTFKIWHGVKQTSGAYPTGLPSTYSALTGILPTEIVVTRVLQ